MAGRVAGKAAVEEEAEDEGLAEFDNDDMNPKYEGEVDDGKVFGVWVPETEEETSLRRLEDGPSLTGWRGDARMGRAAGRGDDQQR